MPRDDIPDSTEVLVIGGGPAGYVAAIRASQLGCDVTLAEGADLGGVCLNHGCIPSKALISATDIAHEAGTADEMGIQADPEIDLARLIEWKDGVVDRLTGGVDKLCKANRVTVVPAMASLTGERTARLARTDGDETAEQEIDFEQAIIATGSRPIELPGFPFDADPIMSSREALSPETRPESLFIIGAGYIGMELAGVYAKLGTDVTVVEMLDSMLPGYDEELVDPVRDRADELGIDVHLERVATDWEAREDGQVDVAVAPADDPENGEQMTHVADRILVAVGRDPVSDTVGLDAVGIEPNESGFVETDSQFRTAVDSIFAVGDVAGEPMLAHAGMAEGLVAAAAAAGESVEYDPRAVPAAVFTDPEIGEVGLTPEEAAERGLEATVGEFPFRASGRALTTGQTDGFVRLVAEGPDGPIVGGQVVGPEASELVAEIGLAIETGATLADVGDTIHVHPTLGEAVMEAAEQGLGRAIHTLNR